MSPQILANFQVKSPHCNGRGAGGGGQKLFSTKLLWYLVRNNMETYYPCTWISFVNQKNEKIRNCSLLMKIIYLLFLSCNFSKQLIYILCTYFLNMQINHQQLRTKSKIFISLETVLNFFNVWRYHLLLKSLFCW